MASSRNIILAALLGVLCIAAAAKAEPPRQYYGGWTYHPERKYFYRYYYFKPTKDFVGYQHQYCIYSPQQPKYVYYYNPTSQKVWGRYDLEARGDTAVYSTLAKADQQARIGDIPDEKFPKPGAMPSVPQSTDGVQMAKLPSDWQKLSEQIQETKSQ